MQDLPRHEFEAALVQGKIEGLSPTAGEEPLAPTVQAIWTTATEAAYAIANARLLVLNALDRGLGLEAAWVVDSSIADVLGSPKTIRTIRAWRRQFREAERMWDNGYVGLIPKTHQQGNYLPKLSEAAQEKMQDFIEKRYETLRQPYTASVWAEYCQACEAEGIPPVSLKTFGKAVKNRPRDVQVMKRQGKRAAHQVQKRYWYLEATTPKHGERAWQIVHLDHTRLDIELQHSQTGKPLGRPWATFAVDAYTRRLLAVVLALDEAPSYRNCMLVLRELVHRFHRLPQSIYVDNGAEFHSTYFQALLAQYGTEVTYRPPGQPRFGDVVERLFRTANTQFVYNLTGNTQIAKQVRLVTKSNNPKNLAIWRLDWLSLALREWAYEIYDQSEHTSLYQSPREAFEASIRQHGERAFKWIDYEMFVLNALPTPGRGGLRQVHPSGVKIDNIYYWHDRMYHPEIAGTQVPVRYDPFNVGIAYAYLDKQWVCCTSEYFTVFNNRTERELQIAREELRATARRHGQVTRHLNARLLASFLEQTTASERLLQQQLRDSSMQFIYTGRTDSFDETLKQRLETLSEEPVQQVPTSLAVPLRSQPTSVVTYDTLYLPDDF